jgi:predicted RNase H-like HicB family nuclease
MKFDVVIRKDEDGYCVATVPALAGCHTQARSLDELMIRIKEVILLCLDAGDRDRIKEPAVEIQIDASMRKRETFETAD